MKWRSNTDQFAVIDDFLSDEDWTEVHQYMEYTTYLHVADGGWNGAWRLDDGRVMRGPSISYGEHPNTEAKYPTHLGVDRFISSLINVSAELRKQIGKEETDWDCFTLLPMLYPRNSGLYWHRDAAGWTGSYTYYVHREWNIEWGGELMVSNAPNKDIPKDWGVFMSSPRKGDGIKGEQSFGAHLDNRDANKKLMDPGMGTFIAPKPNRLVVISEGNPHTISQIRPAAGDRFRMSLSGFFQRPV